MNQFPGGNAAPFFAPPQAPARATMPMPQAAPQAFPMPQRPMPQVQPQGFPNVQRLAQFAQGTPAAPFQGGAVQRPALAGAFAPPAAPAMNIPRQAFAMPQAQGERFPLAQDRPRPPPITGPVTPSAVARLTGGTPVAQLPQSRPAPPPITGPVTPAAIELLQQPTAPPIASVGHRIIPSSAAPAPVFTEAAPAAAPTAVLRRPNVSGTYASPLSSSPLLTSDRRAKNIVSLKSILGA